MALIQDVKWDFIVPIIVAFAIIRTEKVLCAHQRILAGLKFFIPSAAKLYLVKKVEPTNELETDAADKFNKLDMSLTRLDTTIQKCHLVSKLIFAKYFKTMVGMILAVAISQVWYEVYHMAFPEAEYSAWGTMMVAVSATFAWQCQPQILYLTGWRARESKTALVVGLVAFSVCAVWMYFRPDILGYDLTGAFSTLAAHINVLMLFLSRRAPQLPADVLAVVLQFLFCVGMSVGAAAMTIPALRFSQTLKSQLIGSKFETAPFALRVLLCVDAVMPLVCAAILVPEVWSRFSSSFTLTCFSAAAASSQAKESTDSFPGSCSSLGMAYTTPFGLQMVAVLFMACVRMICVKTQLQSFLNVSVRSVLAEITLGSKQVEGMRTKLQLSMEYLVAAAAQYLAAPFLYVATVCLLLRIVPGSFGYGALIRSLLGQNNAALFESIGGAASFNATSAAADVLTTEGGYLDEALHSFLMSSGMGGEGPGKRLFGFMRKVSTVHPMPTDASATLLLTSLAVHCLTWFLLYIGFFLYWTLKPTIRGQPSVIVLDNVLAPAPDRGMTTLAGRKQVDDGLSPAGVAG